MIYCCIECGARLPYEGFCHSECRDRYAKWKTPHKDLKTTRRARAQKRYEQKEKNTMKKFIAMLALLTLAGCPQDEDPIAAIAAQDQEALGQLMDTYVTFKARLEMEIEDHSSDNADYEAFRLAVTKRNLVLKFEENLIGKVFPALAETEPETPPTNGAVPSSANFRTVQP